MERMWKWINRETGADLAALYLPLQDTSPELIQLSFAQRQFYLSDHSLLCCTCWWWRCTNICIKRRSTHTSLAVCPKRSVYLLFGNEKMKSCSIWQSCNTMRAGCREGTQTTACPQIKKKEKSVAIHSYLNTSGIGDVKKKFSSSRWINVFLPSH